MGNLHGDYDEALTLTQIDWVKSEDGTYFETQLRYCAQNDIPEHIAGKYQILKIYVPAGFMNDEGNFNEDSVIGGYTVRTAPVIFRNNCMGWRSSLPRGVKEEWLPLGWIQVECGARSRDADPENHIYSKSPCQVVDLKSGLRMLRLNQVLLPGNLDHVITYGISAGGQMSSMLGATGNMEAYYEMLWQNGAAGIGRALDGTFFSTIDDSVFASMCFCPIAALQAGSLSVAWLRYDSSIDGPYHFSEFEHALEHDLAVKYGEYINSLQLENEEGEILTFDTDPQTGKTDPRSGSYFRQTLKNFSDALNALLKDQDKNFPFSVRSGPMRNPVITTYETWDELLEKYRRQGNAFSKNGTGTWLEERPDGSWAVTDFAGFFHGTGLKREKGIPAFDALYWSEDKNAYTDEIGKETENSALGRPGVPAPHYSKMVAEVLKEHYDDYCHMDGFDWEIVDTYIRDAADPYLDRQLYLVDSMQIMLDVARGSQHADLAGHWRMRMGTADQSSYNNAYNFCMAARMAGSDVDFGLVWEMGHGAQEGTTTGTFADWVAEICS